MNIINAHLCCEYHSQHKCTYWVISKNTSGSVARKLALTAWDVNFFLIFKINFPVDGYVPIFSHNAMAFWYSVLVGLLMKFF